MLRKTREQRRPRVTVITEASESQPEQLRRRQIRYATMMGIRALCLIAAVIIVSLDVPGTPIWVALCIVGMVLLPWMAVIIANDRPPRAESRFTSRLRRNRKELAQQSETDRTIDL